MIALAIESSVDDVLLALSDIPSSIWDHTPGALPEFGLRFVAEGPVFYVLGPKSTADSPLTVFPLSEDGYFDGVDPEARHVVLRRCLFAAGVARTPGRFLDKSWAPYHDGKRGYTIFYSTTIAMGRAGLSARSIIQKVDRSVVVCEFVNGGHAVDLTQYDAGDSAIDALIAAHAHLPAALMITPPTQTGVEFTRVVSHVDPAHGRTLAEWEPLLTDAQRAFLAAPVVGPTRLRGAAGTGKTLALTLKAVHELYRAADEGRPWRGLVLTHNMASAEAIRLSINAIDKRNLMARASGAQTLKISTLAALAVELLDLNRSGLKPLSEDGHEGKTLQLDFIEDFLREFRAGDWQLYRPRCSPGFIARIESSTDPRESRHLAWDLMNEFTHVISATRHLSRDAYLSMQRGKAMMSLAEAADREVVFLLNERFRRFLIEDHETLPTYEIFQDLIAHLDMNMWQAQRRKEGFDLLLVDEFHLFNKQEIWALQYLSRDPHRPPAIVMALDPRQSPSDSFLGFNADKKHPMTKIFGRENVQDVRFLDVFRYTRQIAALLDHMEEFWFGLDLPEDYAQSTRRAHDDGPRPTISRAPDLSHALDDALARARKLRAGKADRSVAVLCLDMSSFDRMCRRIDVLKRENEWQLIDSRDSMEVLAPIGRKFSAVVSQPEYVAGAQFDAVIIVDANDGLVNQGADELLRKRRVLSNLYLALSRARRFVHLIAADSEGGRIHFLKHAVAQEVLEPIA
jgi:hypothetical protein